MVNENDELTGVVIENKDGRSVIKAKAFIDATGDGDLCHRLGLPSYTSDLLLPPTTCAHIENYGKVYNDMKMILKEHRKEVNLPEGYIWGNNIPGTNTVMIAGTRVYNVNCAKADDLTNAEIEGRRQIRAIMDLARKYAPEHEIALTALPSHIGIRQTRQIKCQYTLTGKDVLHGKSFKDTIAYGSYRVDIHHQDKPGITFRYLDGREVYSRPDAPKVEGRWREGTATNPTWYEIPLRSIIPGNYSNLVLAGRMFDADKVAFSGARVMVNMNQLGEAAGVAAWIAINKGIAIENVDAGEMREKLKKGGSVIID
jgi:hydrogenase maturation factor